jgi:putative membrane protein
LAVPCHFSDNKEFSMSALASNWPVLAHLALAFGLNIVFMRIYIWLTPDDDFALMGAGEMAPAISGLCAAIAFSISLYACNRIASGPLAFLLWGLMACAVHIVIYKMLAWGMGETSATNTPLATYRGGLNIALGIAMAGAIMPPL